jgi:hypothetical protein
MSDDFILALSYLRIIILNYLPTIPEEEITAIKSLQIRQLLFTYYSHIRLLLRVCDIDSQRQYSRWDAKFREIINDIHHRFDTIQANPYNEWPTQ